MAIFYLDYINGNDSNDGSDWANAWKTWEFGATAARIAPGDIIRIAKSPAPYSIGNGTWTNLSKIITLSTAQNLTINNCEVNWTAANSATTALVGVATDAKQGSNCLRVTLPASPATGTKYAYYAISSTDFSSYQKISFWIKNSAAILAGHWKVCLCSDTAGDTIVDEFPIDAIPSTANWLPLTLTKVGGGNLGASIQSIAIYSDTVAPAGSSNILVDNFIACTTSGLSLQSLISKNSAEQGGAEPWLSIQSIDGVTVLIDSSSVCKSNQGRGYYGTSETVATYARETTKMPIPTASTTRVNQPMDSGTFSNLIEYQGGWDTGTTLQTGETFVDCLNSLGYGIYHVRQHTKINRISIFRAYYGMYLSTNDITFDVIPNVNSNQGGIYCTGTFQAIYNLTIGSILNVCNNGFGISLQGDARGKAQIANIGNINSNGVTGGNGLSIGLSCGTVDNIDSICNNYGVGVYFGSCNLWELKSVTNIKDNGNDGVEFYVARNNKLKATNISYNGRYGAYFNTSENCIVDVTNIDNQTSYGVYAIYMHGLVSYVKNATISNNGTCQIYLDDRGSINLYNCTLGATEFLSDNQLSNIGSDPRCFSSKHNGVSGKSYIYLDFGSIESDTTVRHTASGISWKISPTNSSYRTVDYPIVLPLAKVAVVADSLVTISAWFKKSHATNIVGKLVCKGGQIAGVDNDVSSTVADNTDWQQISISFTPTETGIVEIEAHVYGGTTDSVWVDDIYISQS